MAIITSLHAREILDSRGNPTIEVDVYAGKIKGAGKVKETGKIKGTAAVPSGASTGKYEAAELRDGGKRFLGLGVQKAIHNVEKVIAPKLKGVDCRQQEKIDKIMIELDGTDNKSRLGANAILGVSLACARTAALVEKKELYEYIHQISKVNKKIVPKGVVNKKITLPRPFFNVINGGKHAGNELAIQEFMIAPRAGTFAEALKIGVEIYQELKKLIERKYGKSAINVGDEGGFAPPLGKAEEALELIKEAVRLAGYVRKVDLAMDCAASEFYREGNYFLPRKMSREKLMEYYLELIKKYKIISLEDPFEEDDFAGFAELREKSGIQIVGDDLTVTNLERIEEAIRDKSCSCLLLKVNQIGTLTEALAAVRLACRHKWKVMVSHRSGETEDTFIADLAVGIGGGMIKAGAPCRGERTAKYNRLLRIEEELRERR